MSRSLPPLVDKRAFLSGGLLCLAFGAGAVRADDSADAGAPAVRLATVGIPVMENGEVVNYLFLSVRINLTLTAPEGKFRDMEPYFRDAMVRLSHKTSFGMAGHSDQLDVPRFTNAMMVEWTKITGPHMIKSIDVLAQSPKRHLS